MAAERGGRGPVKKNHPVYWTKGDTQKKDMSKFKFENTRNLQKLKDIVGKEIAYHDLAYQNGERGFLMNKNRDKCVHSLFTEINFQRRQYVYALHVPRINADCET